MKTPEELKALKMVQQLELEMLQQQEQQGEFKEIDKLENGMIQEAQKTLKANQNEKPKTTSLRMILAIQRAIKEYKPI